MAQKGHRPPNAGKGRPKGSVNKNTAQVKAALQAVYEKKGGDKALLAWALNNETEFYRLWGKMLPQEVSGPDGGAIAITRVERVLVDPKDTDR